MRLIDTDKLKFPNIAIFDMKLHGVTVPMVRLLDLKELMPTVDAVPVVHAHWEGEEYSCSNCHENLNSIMDGWSWFSGGFNGTPYCPYCGAKMDLEGLDLCTQS